MPHPRFSNDQTVAVPVHAATIIWHREERVVRVLAVGRRALLGTALLNQNHLGSDFTEGGGVAITPHGGPSPSEMGPEAARARHSAMTRER